MTESVYDGAQTATDICRTELDERDLVHCLVQAGLIVGITNVDGLKED